MAKRLAIRLDASPSIGSGHAMRCSSIAREAVRRGWDVEFLVSDVDSLTFLDSIGMRASVLGGDGGHLVFEDGLRLRDACDACFDALIVDSYGVTDGFFDGLSGIRCRTCLVDDMYTFECGNHGLPIARDVDVVLDYEFFADERAYRDAYSGTGTELLVGPAYAPLREEFTKTMRGNVAGGPLRILVTSGATNPGCILERIAGACANAAPDAELIVVVGAMADFDERSIIGSNARLLRGVTDMASLMAASDMAVSAAGSTLYELCCMGVPTVAIPTVENQVANAEGFARHGFGEALSFNEWTLHDLEVLIAEIAGSADARRSFIRRAMAGVDGLGAQRVCDSLLV